MSTARVIEVMLSQLIVDAGFDTCELGYAFCNTNVKVSTELLRERERLVSRFHSVTTMSAKEYTDRVLALDAIVVTEEKIIGIDFTTDEDAVKKKRKKISKLTPLYKELGIDEVIVLYVQMGEEEIVGYNLLTPKKKIHLIAMLQKVVSRAEMSKVYRIKL